MSTAALDALPRPAAQRIALRVTPDAQRRLRAGHPWLYDRSIRSASREGSPGDLAVVFADDRRFLAIGLWDPDSPIRVKVLHAGAPQQIDGAWFVRTVSAAADRRAPLLAQGDSTAYRLVHGENDGLPGLVLDRYDDVLVLKLYTAAWLPHLAMVVAAVEEVLAPRSVVLRISRTMRDRPLFGLHEGETLVGPDVAAPVEFRENGLRFEADVVHGQKTGHFLDQRDNRARVRALARGQRVLDVFCCTGGFSVHAAAGGAAAVTAIDASPHALAGARRNAALNALSARAIDTVEGDAFAVMERLAEQRRRFDLVVVDPPSFAHNAAMVPRALAAYARLTVLALALVDRGGTLVQASCSSRVGDADFFRTVHRAAAEAGFELDEIERTGHPLDHPIGFEEGAYLKALFAHPRWTR